MGQLVRDFTVLVRPRTRFIQLVGTELVKAVGFELLDAAHRLAYDLIGRPEPPDDRVLQRLAHIYDVLELAQQHLRILPSEIQQYRQKQTAQKGRFAGLYLWQL